MHSCNSLLNLSKMSANLPQLPWQRLLEHRVDAISLQVEEKYVIVVPARPCAKKTLGNSSCVATEGFTLHLSSDFHRTSSMRLDGHQVLKQYSRVGWNVDVHKLDVFFTKNIVYIKYNLTTYVYTTWYVYIYIYKYIYIYIFIFG